MIKIYPDRIERWIWGLGEWVQSPPSSLIQNLDEYVEFHDDVTLGDLFEHISKEFAAIELTFSSAMGHHPLLPYYKEICLEPESKDDELDAVGIGWGFFFMEEDENIKGEMDVYPCFYGIAADGGANYSLSFTKLCDIAHLPIIADEKIVMWFPERKLTIESRKTIAVGDVLHAILYDITFYGLPDKRDKTREEVVGMRDEYMERKG